MGGAIGAIGADGCEGWASEEALACWVEENKAEPSVAGVGDAAEAEPEGGQRRLLLGEGRPEVPLPASGA